MFCPKCGENLEDGAKFCPSCGTVIEADAPAAEEKPAEPVVEAPAAEIPAVETPAVEAAAPEAGYTPEAKPAKKSPLSFLDKLPVSPKVLGIGCAALVVLVLLIVIIASAGGGASGAYTTVSDYLYISSNDDVAYVVGENGKVQTIDVDGYVYSSVSPNGKAGVVYSEGSLYYVTNSSVKKITDDSTNYFISQDGSTVVYLEEGDDAYDLYTYKGGKSTKIASDVSSSPICISPNGGTIGYATYDNGDYRGYIYDGSEHELGKNKVAVAVSNGANYVYLRKDGSLYVQKKYNEDSRIKLSDNAYYVYYNVDLSEVLVYDGEKTVYSSKAGEKQTAFKYDPSILLPMNTLRDSNTSEGYIYGVKSFIGSFFTNDGKVVRLNRDMTTPTVAKSVSSAQLAKDGKTIIYRKDDKIRKVNGSKNDPEPVDIADEADGFLATEDGNTVYYVQDGELFAVKGTGKGQKVTEDFYDADIYNGKTFLYTDGDVLYSSTGSKGKSVASFDDDISSVYTYGKLVIIRLSDGTVQYSTNGSRFSVLYEG